jgi:hypothetical protein
MARSRHGRSRGGPSSADSGLPSWAQRHLDEAGDPVTAADVRRYPAPLTHRRQGRADAPHRMRGWGVAIVAVAAAVGAVPLAITSLANDHSDDPLPKVDTYTAGAPAPLETDGGSAGARHRADTPAVPGSPGSDPSTAGVLAAPPAPPVAAAPIVPGRRLAAPVPAALIRATPTVPPTTTTKATTPRSATPTTTTSTDEGRTATPPKTKPKPPAKPAPKPQAPSSDDDGGSQPSGGLVSNTVRGLGNTVSGVTGSLGL